MNGESKSVICDAVEQLYFGSTLMTSIFVSELITVIISLALAALLVFAISITGALHFNVRLLLICVCAASIISNIGVMISSVFFIGASFNENVSERCNELTFSTSKCVALRRVQSSGALVITASTIFLALERLIATCCFRSYENGGRKSIGFVLTFLLCVTAAPASLHAPPATHAVYPYCAVAFYNPRQSRDISFALFAVQMAAALIFAALWYQNVKQTRESDDHRDALTVRYQLRENVNTTRLMIPIVIINSFFMLACSVVYAVFLPPLTTSLEITSDVLHSIIRYAPIAESLILLLPATTIIFMLLLVLMSIHIRRSVLRLTGLQRFFLPETNTVGPLDHAVAGNYFEQLKQQWQLHYSKAGLP
ncbi:Serpentine receptor class alpha/beta-14 [Toxocara canis]|uniref:Serpentine receptor class alpha/beta-14 n=1 Tax=Toxocara canis TaxID=6265 RepID=A0A0B2VZA8_TOXCA|nr:Serpentine receptor class alpha/beta-14 [Toxocara canis]